MQQFIILLIGRAITAAASLINFGGIISWPGDLRTLISFSNSSAWVSLARGKLKQAGALEPLCLWIVLMLGWFALILTVILYSYFRHAISNVNKVVIRQIGNFLLSLIILSFSFKIMSLACLPLVCEKGRKVVQNSRGCSVSAVFLAKCCFIPFRLREVQVLRWVLYAS